MKTSYEKYCKFAIHILTTVQNTKSVTNISVNGYSQFEIDEFIAQCVENKFIAGIDCWHDANGNPHLEKIGTPILTINGFQYLNSLYAKSFRKTAKNSAISSAIAIIISLVGFLIQIPQYIPSILEYLPKKLNRLIPLPLPECQLSCKTRMIYLR